MHAGLQWIDRIAAWGLVLIGCIHNFVAAPAIFATISVDLFWFLSAGLALWYAGAANVVRQMSGTRSAVLASIPVNLTLLAFVTAFGIHTGEIASAGGAPLIALALIETAFAIAQAVRPGGAQPSTSASTHSA